MEDVETTIPQADSEDILSASSEVPYTDHHEPKIEINPDEVHQIIEKLPNKRDREVMRAIVMESRFSGPLPPPEFLAGYKEVLPDAPERILKMAEMEQAHRHDIERSMASTHAKQNGLGQIFGFALALLFGAFSLVLALNGAQTLAGIFGTTTIIGLAIIFVLHERPKVPNDEEETE